MVRFAIGFIVIALAVWAALAAVVAGLTVAFAADPTFWPAFWLVLVVLIALSSISSFRAQVTRRR